MNQAILFNDDLKFDKEKCAFTFSGLIAGERLMIYIYSNELQKVKVIDQCTKYDLEEITELWLEKNEPDGNEIHIMIK